MAEKKGSPLFVCVHNAGRSQMAEAFAKSYGLKASSAGTMPSATVNPMVVQVMKEKGIDLSSNSPKMLTTDMINEASLAVTMGCSVEQVCPRPMLAKMQKKLIDWRLEDPKGQTIEKVREIRDEIEGKVKALSEPSDHVRMARHMSPVYESPSCTLYRRFSSYSPLVPSVDVGSCSPARFISRYDSLQYR